jgi:hypothetical protein
MMTDKIIIHGAGNRPIRHQARAADGDRAAFISVGRYPEKLNETRNSRKGRRY